MIIVTSAKVRRDIRENLIQTHPDIDFRFHTHINDAEDDLKEAEILITYGEDLTENHIYSAINLKWIMVIAAGLDKMPFVAIENKGIIVTSAKGIHAIPMAEYTMSMMLQVARQAKTVISNEQNKKWDRFLEMTELHRKTIGILGAGAIGQEIARLAKAFNMKVIGLNRTGKQLNNFDKIVTKKDIDNLLNEADFVITVLPKMKETNEILAKDQFNQMKENAILINIGRGNVINEEDLLAALASGKLMHAVLDVFHDEPLPQDHPFWLENQITVTPHISGISPQYQPRAFEIFDHNLNVFCSHEGNYINLIDPRKGY
ncbi:D-2-hydroxyacid dehydrogenase [Salipaludibacillus keqinensis]|uniref:D-2-hydroxyacid dehydrogenase n=1 Tax=Salipaludibacillus keqinensis TaxID=2045207 RepID=A0A323TE63_9BACI|nr:D-2-hydroxyacid dehydrogenase [Salipaludibacillus keqinensis]PYZ92434.1 D-2-hydroxyacid dehydrogenase [Salipaludibacillus keqinensis]